MVVLVRRLQQGMSDLVHRLDDVPLASTTIASFRSGMGELHGELRSARGALHELVVELGEHQEHLKFPRGFLDQLESLEELVERVEEAASTPLSGLETQVNRLQELNDRVEQALGAPVSELQARLARLFVERLEGGEASSPPEPLPPAVSPEAEAEHETLRAELANNRQILERADAEVAALTERLHAAELARSTLESRHVENLTELADRARNQIERLEDELKKKKRGLSELTEQNIQLQTELQRLRASPEAPVESGEAEGAPPVVEEVPALEATEAQGAPPEPDPPPVRPRRSSTSMSAPSDSVSDHVEEAKRVRKKKKS